MAKNRTRKFTELFEVETFLNGGLIGGPLPNGSISGLVGKTLIFTSPDAITVTFVASANPDPQVLFLSDIKAQVEAVATNVTVFSMNGKLLILENTPTSGVGIDKDGTANILLGFPTNADNAGKLYAPPPSSSAPCWTWMSVDNNGQHVITTWE